MSCCLRRDTQRGTSNTKQEFRRSHASKTLKVPRVHGVATWQRVSAAVPPPKHQLTPPLGHSVFLSGFVQVAVLGSGHVCMCDHVSGWRRVPAASSDDSASHAERQCGRAAPDRDRPRARNVCLRPCAHGSDVARMTICPDGSIHVFVSQDLASYKLWLTRVSYPTVRASGCVVSAVLMRKLNTRSDSLVRMISRTGMQVVL